MAANSLRVLHLIDTLAVGGAEAMLVELARAAPDHGIDLHVAYLKEHRDSPVIPRLRAAGVAPRLVDVGGRLGAGAVRTVRAHVREVAPDLLHTHLVYGDLLGGLASAGTGVRMVSTVHATQWESGARGQARARLAALARRTRARRVITVSDSAREALLRLGWDRPQRVVTVHNGIAGEPRIGAGAELRRELGLASDDVVVAMVSTLRPEKGHDVAIPAVAQVRADHPSVRLLIAGSGRSQQQVERVAAAHPGTAVLAGYRPDPMAVLDAADLVLHPSRHDAFPTSLLEAMAARLPVVATRVGGIPEIVEDRVTGLLVDPPPRPAPLAEALRRVVADPSLREQMGDAARERFEEHFSAAAWTGRLLAVYGEALA